MDAVKIREYLDFLKSQGFEVKLRMVYTPESHLYDTEKLYELYYGGHGVIEIHDKYYTINWHEHKLETPEDFERGIDRIVELIKDNIAPYVHQALENIGEDPECLKYFDRPEEQPIYDTFKAEVLRLRDEARK